MDTSELVFGFFFGIGEGKEGVTVDIFMFFLDLGGVDGCVSSFASFDDPESSEDASDESTVSICVWD